MLTWSERPMILCFSVLHDLFLKNSCHFAKSAYSRGHFTVVRDLNRDDSHLS